MKAQCGVCLHRCILEEGQRGLCRGRICRGGRIVCENYGRLTACALDPIEKKPLRRFHPGSHILSVGSYGCNLACPFCQNEEIAMTDGAHAEYEEMTPEELTALALSAKQKGNIGIAYTYNEPMIGYEYVRDCAVLAKKAGLFNVVVTNGSVMPETLLEVLPYVDAFNVDLKGFTEAYYKSLQGDLKTVQTFLKLAAAESHVEVTTLIVPGKNDSSSEIGSLARWLAELDETIPLHVSRFFPACRMSGEKPTETALVYRLANEAKRYLKYVYTGNC